MIKRLAGVVALVCACGTAVAGYGFEPVAALVPEAVGARALAVGDLSGDGRDDLIVLAGGSHPFYREKVLVYAQTAAGNLAPPVAMPYGATEFDYAGQLKLADFDGDGRQDILLAHDSGLKLLRNQGDLQFALSTLLDGFSAPSNFNVMDVDVDGNLDVVIVEYGTVYIHHGDGVDGIGESISFSVPWGRSPHLVDMNGDGLRDLAYIDDWSRAQMFVHPNEGTGFSGQYYVIPLPLGGRAIGNTTIADLGGDVLPEIAGTSSAWPRSNIAIFEQSRPGSRQRRTFLPTSSSYGGSLMGEDIDADGRTDLIYASDAEIALFLNHANGFEPEARFYTGSQITQAGTAIGDLNGDGLKDIVVGTYFGGVSYLKGRASPMESDLGVYLGLSDSMVAVRVDNHSQDMESEGYSVIVELDARFGGVFLDGVPEGCESYGDWYGHDAYLRCGMDALAPGAHRILTLPITIPPRAGTNQLTVHAFLETRYGDLRRDNDHARKRLTIFPSAVPSRR